MATVAERAAEAPPKRTAESRASAAIAFFGTWMVAGLFVDGWAHEHQKPETFFTPWHALLYSGFGAAVLWFMYQGRRGRGASVDRLTLAGFLLFGASAVGDFAWHTLFGI